MNKKQIKFLIEVWGERMQQLDEDIENLGENISQNDEDYINLDACRRIWSLAIEDLKVFL